MRKIRPGLELVPVSSGPSPLGSLGEHCLASVPLLTCNMGVTLSRLAVEHWEGPTRGTTSDGGLGPGGPSSATSDFL